MDRLKSFEQPKASFGPEDTDVVVLCGGQGVRLRQAVNDRPKVLAPISGRPFLDILVDNLRTHGFGRVILSVGFLKEQIIDYYKDKPERNIVFSSEETPLGTGGALKQARPFVRSDHFFVMNGDSLCDVDFRALSIFHLGKESIFTIVVAPANNRKDGGIVALGAGDAVIGYKEKDRNGLGFINGGIYLAHSSIFDCLPEQERFSLEYDVFPRLVGKRFYAFKTDGEILDIGTPERYAKIKRIFSERRLAV